MEAQIKNQGGKEPVQRIKANLAETQHRFEISDPLTDTTYKFQTAEAITAKVNELGASRFQKRSADGQVSQISKVDSVWTRSDGKSLADIQAEIDKDSVIAIAARAEQRKVTGQGVDAKTYKQMALADARDFRRIQNPGWQEIASVQIAENANTSPAYQAALEKAAPKVAQEVKDALVREAINLNTVSPNIEKQHQPLAGEEAKAAQSAVNEKSSAENKVESDEAFTARQSDRKPVVPPDIEKQYLRVGDIFYHHKNTDTVAFEDKGNRLETKSNSENIAESMVRIAEARGWDEIKVSGSETFRKEVWLEAASRGMHIKGYSPTELDKVELANRISKSETNKIEKGNKPFRARENDAEEAKPDSQNKKAAEAFANQTATDAVKTYPELAGAVAAVAAMEKKAEADGLNPQQRAVVSARIHQNVVNSIERGDIPKVKIKVDIEIKREPKEEREYAR
jgi:hypothetical protein